MRNVSFFFALGGISFVHAAGDVEVEFNRDIRPLLSNKCFACHGPDENERQAGLRLDTAAGAFAEREGVRPIVPGRPGDSELYRRITAPHPDDRMPPARFGKTLSGREVELLRDWIAQGAQWQSHWSLNPPSRPPVPSLAGSTWGRNVVDAFVLERLRRAGLEPSPEADRRTLLRRLSFDLTGLPPAPADYASFLYDDSDRAYENLVERLLATQAYGERMAQYWLDLVRFADTNGIHGDNHRDIALFRDYVIRAFNDNKPFDEFTTEQLAGDLLEGATMEDKIASGYNRLLMTTREGGAQPKEYRAKYAADRVRNASSVWLGATLGCSECHDHKFDPYSTKDFYSFAAFFADIEETAVGHQEPILVPSEEEKAELERLEQKLAEAEAALQVKRPELEAAQRAWEDNPTEGGAEVPEDVAGILAVARKERTSEQAERLAAHYRSVAPLLEPYRKSVEEARAARDAWRAKIPKTLVSVAMKEPRVTRILPRGNWLDDSGRIVEPDVPASLPALEVAGRRATRYDLARWLVRRDNPMVARVFVNRLWKIAFGQGIVSSLDDFGSQGAWPTHPRLLDWLALEFIDGGWDIKRILKLLVMSSAYRQSSLAPRRLLERDPYNALLARQNRFRLDAEMVRDNALAVSGLLWRDVGGPSAKPYQPPGYWVHLNFPKREYEHDAGESLYRRGLYTYWCRTFLHPSLLAFDAPTREECAVERPRSNTPQQALVLLNDPVYVEAARALAERLMREGGESPAERVAAGYRLVLGREASAQEVELLSGLFSRHLAEYTTDPGAAQELSEVGERHAPADLDARDVAAWTSVARVLLNLHETITRY